MEIPSPQFTLTPLGPSTPGWTPGQVLNAVVESIVGGDRVALRIGSALVETDAAVGLSAGQRLTLQVVRSEAQLLLRILPSAAEETPAASGTGRTAPTGTVLTLTTALPADLALTRGARLQAMVTAREGERLTVAIGDRTFEARAAHRLTAGTRLTVEVVQAERPAILKVVEENAEGDTLRNAMRAALPRQAPLQSVFARLAALPAAPGGVPAALLKHLLQNLPEIEQLTRAGNVKAAVENAGQLLEPRLMRDAPSAELRQDLKANLLRLLAALNQGTDQAGELSRQIEAAVARIQLHQLAAAADQDAPVWAGEIPLRHGDAVDVCRLRIDREGGKDGEGRNGDWSTWISLDLRALGPLHVRLTLGGFRLATTFWAESDATAALVNEHLDTLRQALEGAGLEVADLQCHRGRPPFLPPDRLPAGLLDILA